MYNAERAKTKNKQKGKLSGRQRAGDRVYATLRYPIDWAIGLQTHVQA